MKTQSRAVTVILPNKKELSLTVGLKDRGQDVFNQIAELLDISDLHLFGLSVVKDNQALFLDLEHKLASYLPKSWRKNTSEKKSILSLKVQYFVENAQLITSNEARQLYYAELKGRVLRSQCFESEGLYFQLAAYALQSDLGDCEEPNLPYFNPLEIFPLWIIQKRGNDFICEHTPALHLELKGMSSSEAASLFIRESFTLSDVPLTSYSLFKEKSKARGCRVLLGLRSTGLQISEMLNGEQQFLYDLPWTTIHSITFQGKKFEICADGLHEEKLALYCHSVLHAKNLLQHISNSHRAQMNTTPLVRQLGDRNSRGKHREMYISDGADLDIEDSDDELPVMKVLLKQKKTTECPDVQGSGDTFGFEMSVDGPEEMFVDDPEDVLRLVEQLVGTSVDQPSLLPVSHWKGLAVDNCFETFVES